MSSLNEFLNKLNNLGVKLWLEDVQDTNSAKKFRLKYNAPKDTINPALLSELQEYKADIIQFLQQANQSKDISHQSIQPAPRDKNLPLSFAQQRLWFLEQLEESSSTYNWGRILRLEGSLNIKALEASINEIVRRHQVLRTAFIEIDGTPIQKICEPQPIKIQVLDLQHLPAEAKLEKAWSLATKEQNQPFDLLSGLLIRVGLIQLEPENHLLLLTLHHIVTDGWFMSIFLQELTTLYQAFCDDKPSPLPELPTQYADFAYWQRQHFQGETLQKLVDYWKQELAGVPPLLELPTDRPRPPIQTFSGRTEWILLDQELHNKLKTLTKESGVTLFMTLLTAFGILLYRYSGQSDIVIGSPVANRNRSEFEGLIGFFVNSLALRVKITENSTFSQLLTQVKQVALDAYKHQDLPFEKLVEELQLERNLSYSPVFQTMFVWQNSPKGKSELPKLNIEELEPENVVAKFDLSLEMVEVEQGLAAGFEYNTDLFDAATIKRMTGHFQTLLEGIVNNPIQKVDYLPLITIAEKQQILYEWNEEPIEYHLCIHQLFETQAKRTPDAVAVKFEEQELTYQELNIRSNQLAHYLQDLGVEAEVKVGICLERSLEIIITVLAILKAGGAYVPLDPNYPSQRLEWILSDSQVKVLLTTEKLQNKLPENQAKIVFLDTQQEKITTYTQTNPKNPVKPHNLAYIIYTSASTGKPKGVMIEHHSLASFSCSAIAEYEINSEDRVLQFASLSFDVAVEEIYPCLITGGTVVLRTEEMLNSLSTFITRCQEWEITILDLPTAYWHQLTYELANSNLTLPESVRLVIFGGEAVNSETVKLWLETVGEYPQLINAYGPTETTVEATTYRFTIGAGRSPLQNQQIPIGKPIANAQVYILDKHLQPVPVGIPGEVYIGGTGVARGYWNQPELTQEKFILNLIHSSQQNNPQLRLYKTGDLGKYLPDGNIEYLGRIDNQVKIRGLPIELGEIESRLNQHPHVQQAVVIAREDIPGDKRLVAYIVLNQEQTFTTKEMASFLKEKLPSYMIPSGLVIVETLPLTPNDKIDRASLPKPDYSLQDRDTDFVAPSNPIEKQLADIWTAILRVENISIHDNFFKLGGHSLLATQLMCRIRQSLSVELPLQVLFESPTIKGLAEKIAEIQTVNKHSSLVPIQPKGDKKPLFCVHSGYGEILLYQNLAFRLDPDRPVYGLLAKEADGNITGITSIEAIATHYVKEIKAFQPQGPYFISGVCIGGTVAVEIARQLKAQGEDVPLVAVFGTAPLHFSESPSHQSKSLTKSPTTQEKLISYWDFLDKLSLPEKIVHLADKTYEKIDYGLYLFKKFIEPYKYEVYRKLEKPLSQDLQRFQVYLINNQAQDNFEQKVFDGKLISFWASLDKRFSLTEQMSWADVVKGEVKLYDLPEVHIERALNGPDIQNIADTLRQELDIAETDNNQQELKNTISQFPQAKSWSSLIPIQPKGSKPPLFCIHGSKGVNCGEPLYGYDLARNLNSNQPIYGLRAVGLDGKTNPLNTIEAMASKYLAEIRDVYPSGSYLLLGVDIGGLIALEMAQQLLKQGKKVPLLAIINAVSNNSLAKSPINFLPQIVQSIQTLQQNTRIKFIRNYKENHLANNLRYFSIQQSLIQAQKKYQAKVYQNNLTIFSTSKFTSSIPSSINWKKIKTKNHKIYQIQGNSTNIFKTPNIEYLSSTIQACIDEALSDLWG